jgi:hypothetical protein
MIGKHINDIVLSDLHALVGNACERYNLEFKSTLLIDTKSDRKEFLADVSSFANASGGDVIYGVEEIGGKASAAPGIPVSDPDKTSLAVEELIRNGIEERIEVAVRQFEISPGRFIVLIRVYEGMAKPHQVSFAGTSKYYARGNAGKYQLNQSQITEAFKASLERKNHISQFFTERFNQIAQRNSPVPMHPYGLVALILIPSGAFGQQPGFDITRQENKLLPPMGGGGHSFSFNGDGLLSSSGYDHSRRDAYLQIRKNGILETVNSGVCCSFAGQNTLPVSESYNYEKVLVDCLTGYLIHYDRLGVAFPVSAQVALLNCKDHWLNWPGNRNAFQRNTPLLTDRLVSDDMVIYSSKTDVPRLLKPFFDTVWNHAGWERSYNFDDNGQWNPRR